MPKDLNPAGLQTMAAKLYNGKGSGCGSVGRAVASDHGVLQFKSGLQQNLH